jgi:Fe-Mn family superoxide dismutase
LPLLLLFDLQNRRPDFIQTFIDKLINWEVVADRYAKATA